MGIIKKKKKNFKILVLGITTKTDVRTLATPLLLSCPGFDPSYVALFLHVWATSSSVCVGSLSPNPIGWHTKKRRD